MTELTALTLAQAREGLRKREGELEVLLGKTQTALGELRA